MSDFNIVIEENPTDVHIDIDPDIDQTNINIDTQQAPVQSVNGKIGFVHIDKNDIGLSDVENISISGVSGYLRDFFIDSSNGFITGVDLSDYVTKLNGEFINRPQVNGTGVLLQGEATQGITNENVVYTSGSQIISGDKYFLGRNNRIGSSQYIETDDDFIWIRQANGRALFDCEEMSLFDFDQKLSVAVAARRLTDENNFPILEWNSKIVKFFGNRPTYNGSGISLIGIYNVKYNELLTLKNSGLLEPGGFYRISDFILKWRIDSVNTDQVLSGDRIEPLYVMAKTSGQLNEIAYSELYDDDIVYYDVEATGCRTWGSNAHKSIPDFKGWIYRRINTTKNIDICWDWRNIKVNCCKLNLSSIDNFNINNEYYEQDLVRYQNNLYFLVSGYSQNIYPDQNSIAWKRLLPPFFGFNDTDIYIPTNEIGALNVLYDAANENYYRYSIPFDINSRRQFLTFITDFNNTGLNLNFVNDIYIKEGVSNLFINQFNGGFVNNKINSLNYNLINRIFSNNNIYALDNNVIGVGFIYNNSIKPISNNIFIGNCSDNKFDGSLSYNYFGNNFISNELFGELMANIIGDNAQNNIIKPESSFLHNLIGDNFKLNTINSLFQYNYIGINFINNNIRSNFYINEIGNYFIANQLNDDFEDNIIYDFCTNNAFNNKSLILDIFDNFRNNKIETLLTNVSFFEATHVYNEYNTTIFKNSNNVYRLSYYGGADQLIVTDITA